MRKGSRRCDHGVISDFKVAAHEWRCSACGVIGVWAEGWEYYGSIGCRWCHAEPAIQFVTCSNVCREKFDVGAEHRTIQAARNANVERAGMTATVAALDKRIDALKRKRDALKSHA